MAYMNSNDMKKDPNKQKRTRNNIIICVVALLTAFMIVTFLNTQIQRSTQKEMS